MQIIKYSLFNSLSKILVGLIIISKPALAVEDGFHFMTAMGFSKSKDSHLTIYKDGVTMDHDAQWEGRPFEDAIYLSAKFEKWRKSRGWGLELIHHKIYLKNQPDYLQVFNLSDGYNLLYVNRGWQIKRNNAVRLGLGVVLVRPEVHFTGENRYFHDSGNPFLLNRYGIGGPSAQVSYSQRLWESVSYYVNWEAKLTASYTKFGVSNNEDDYAKTSNFAVHVLLNFGSKPWNGKHWRALDYGRFFLPVLYPTVGAFMLEGPKEIW